MDNQVTELNATLDEQTVNISVVDTISTQDNIDVETEQQVQTEEHDQDNDSDNILDDNNNNVEQKTSIKHFLTKVVDGNVVHQKRSENIKRAIKCLTPIDKQSVIYKITKDLRTIPVLFGSTKNTGQWEWRNKNTQQFFDKKNALNIKVAKYNMRSNRQNYILNLLSKRTDATNLYQYITDLSIKQFNAVIKNEFCEYQFENDTLKNIVRRFVESCKRKDDEFKKLKINVRVNCEKCGRCGEQHSNYSVKLDSNSVPYVICENTNKRIDVLLNPVNIDTHSLHSLRDIMYGTQFQIVGGDTDDIERLKNLM